MKKYCQKKIAILAVILIPLLIAGCGFHARSSADVPPELHTLYLQTPNPYSQFSASLSQLLRAVDIQLVKSDQKAPYQLLVTRVHYSHNNPGITSSNTAVQFTFIYSAAVKLVDAKGHSVVPPRGFSASRTLLLNLNQVYTPAAGQLAKNDLERDVISQIYNWLVSRRMHDALLFKSNRKRKRHAVKSVRHAS